MDWIYFIRVSPLGNHSDYISYSERITLSVFGLVFRQLYKIPHKNQRRTLMSPKQKRIWFCRRSSSSALWRISSSRLCWLRTATTSRGNTSFWRIQTTSQWSHQISTRTSTLCDEAPMTAQKSICDTNPPNWNRAGRVSSPRFPSKRNRLRCVRCVWMETGLNASACQRWQAANHSCYCFDRASYWLIRFEVKGGHGVFAV